MTQGSVGGVTKYYVTRASGKPTVRRRTGGNPHCF